MSQVLGPWGACFDESNTPPSDAASWLPATVPGTSLGVLVAAGRLPDPYLGTNSPVDAFHARGSYTAWWRCTFDVADASLFSSLHLRGANYRVSLYLNGAPLPLSSRWDVGQFLPKIADVTGRLRATGNVLHVRCEPPDNPGCVDRGGQGGDHALARDGCQQSTQGWDWAPPVADRNTGLWDVVALQQSGAAALRDASVAADVLVTDPGLGSATASLRVLCALDNVSDQPLDVSLQASLQEPGGGQALPMGPPAQLRLAPHSSLDAVEVVRDWAVAQPQLWWPLGMGGSQPLYRVTVAVSVGGAASDERSLRIGLRSLEAPMDAATGGRVFVVNGVRLFVRGANWIASDHMLRPRPDGSPGTSRCVSEVRMLSAAGLNMLRVWGGCGAERDDFYDACDALGMLVWQEFWISGDCNGRGIGGASPPNVERDYPSDHALFLASAAALVRRLRSRPSLALWCGGNEQTPAADLEAALRVMLCPGSGTLDAQTLFVPGSMWDGFAQGGGAFSDGPYGCVPLEEMFAPNFYAYAFNPEAGAAGVPVLESLMRALPDPAQAAPPRLAFPQQGVELTEECNAAWTRHCFEGHGLQLLRYLELESTGGGAPAQLSLADYCLIAQLVAFEQWRGLLESYAGRAWTQHTGLLLWKAHNPMPSFRSALYDWYLDSGGGVGGATAALRRSPHCQLDAATREACVFVSSGRAQAALPGGGAAIVVAHAYALDGSLAWTQRSAATALPSPLAGGGAARTGLFVPFDLPIVFLRLAIEGEGPETSGRNVYWLHPRSSSDAFRRLQAWREEGRSALQLRAAEYDGGGVGAVEISNVGKTVAFFLRLQLRRSAAAAAAAAPPPRARRGGWACCLGRDEALELRQPLLQLAESSGADAVDDRVLPVEWTDQYVTLMPGEALVVRFSCEPAAGTPLTFAASGWNVEATSLALRP